MKKLLVGFSALMMSVMVLAGPDYHNAYLVDYRYVKVIDSEPVYQRGSYYEQDCYRERRSSYRHNDADVAAGAIVGGVIGAAVGSNAGNNHHENVVGAAVGAVVGGVIGAGIASNDINVHYDQQVNCRNSRHYSRNRIEGYNVTFVMDGERYQVFTNANPGSRMKVKMTLEVVE